MFDIKQFRELIIKSSLNDLRMYSTNAEELLIFTCAAESNGGTYLKQKAGPALGIFQMEPDTYNDIWQNYLKYRASLYMTFSLAFNVHRQEPIERLIYDLRFATAMTRIFYARFAEPLPDASSKDALWDYYKKYYNTSKGAATKDVVISQYEHFLRC